MQTLASKLLFNSGDIIVRAECPVGQSDWLGGKSLEYG